MPSALVTGGAGFIGSHLVDHLIRDLGWEVIVVDDLSGGRRDQVHSEARLVEGSIVDPSTLERAFWEREFDAVFHLAAFASEGLSDHVRRHCYLQNLVGSANVLNEAVNSGVGRFVFISSAAVYGEGPVPSLESQRLAPMSSYGVSKAAIERELELCQEHFGLDYSVLRLHNVYGSRQRLDDPYRNVIGIFMNCLLRSEPIRIFGDGKQERPFTHVSDVVPYIARAAWEDGARNTVINIGSDERYDILSLAEAVMEALGREAPIEHLPARLEPRRVQADHQRFRAIFEPESLRSLREGLVEMAAWANKVGGCEPAPLMCPEVSTSLPEPWRLSYPAGPKR